MSDAKENTSLIEKQNSGTALTRFYVLLYGLSYGFALNITRRAQPQYVYSFLKNTDRNTTNVSISKTCTDNNEDIIQQEASSWSWYFIITEYGLSVPIVILIGPLSDRFGRKPILIWNGFLTFLSYVCRTLVVYKGLSLYYLLATHVIDGLSGSFYTFDLANHAIITDITAVDNSRSFLMVVFNSILGVSVMTASLLTGYTIKWKGYTLPFFITTCILLFYVLLLKITLKEPKIKSQYSTDKQSTSTQLLQIISLCRKDSVNIHKLGHLMIFIVIYFLYYFPFNSFDVLRTLYQLGPPFCWSSVHIGWYGSAEDMEIFVLATVIMKVLQCFFKDEIITVLGLISSAGCLSIFGIASKDWMIYAGNFIFLLRFIHVLMFFHFCVAFSAHLTLGHVIYCHYSGYVVVRRLSPLTFLKDLLF